MALQRRMGLLSQRRSRASAIDNRYPLVTGKNITRPTVNSRTGQRRNDQTSPTIPLPDFHSRWLRLANRYAAVGSYVRELLVVFSPELMFVHDRHR